jgi:hypothetical protein
VASGQMTAPTGRTYDCTVRRRSAQKIPRQPGRSTYEEDPFLAKSSPIIRTSLMMLISNGGFNNHTLPHTRVVAGVYIINAPRDTASEVSIADEASLQQYYQCEDRD